MREDTATDMGSLRHPLNTSGNQPGRLHVTMTFPCYLLILFREILIKIKGRCYGEEKFLFLGNILLFRNLVGRFSRD